ncbi:MAG: hypothetical protein JNN30_21020 [Rhodanobacteraceae bacterium]|nr:hypothetical protein [Rhodanobacteraceae bacterium]
MKKKILAALLACGTSIAQAQTWTQVVESAAPLQFLSLAQERSLAADGEGRLFVQTSNLRVSGSASIEVHALDAKGNRLAWLTSSLPSFSDGLFVPKGISARQGDRVNWVESGPEGARQQRVFLYRAGQTMFSRAVSFQVGAVLSHAISNGAGGVHVAYRAPGSLSRPTLSFYGVGSAYWSRHIGGCANGSNLPVELLALDFDPSRGTLNAVSRCLDASSAGTIALQTFDPATGALLAVRRSWPYAGSVAPVTSAQAIGNGAFVLEQHDATSGQRILRRADINGEGDALPLPEHFVPQAVARYDGGALIPAVNAQARALGAWQFDDKSATWLDFPRLSGADFPYLPDFPPVRFAWGGDAAGNSVVAFKRPQSDESGPVQLVAMNARGEEMWRRSIDAYPFTQPVGNVALIAVPESDEIVLAADEIRPPEPGVSYPTGVIHVEQFRIDDGTGTIGWPGGTEPAPHGQR